MSVSSASYSGTAFVSYSLVQAIGSREVQDELYSLSPRYNYHHRHSSFPGTTTTTTTGDEEARRLPRLPPKDALQHFRLGIDVEHDPTLDLRPCAQDLSDLQKDLYQTSAPRPSSRDSHQRSASYL